MTIREHVIPYAGGSLAVRDYGGEGHDVLLVHAPGYCAAAWDTVASALDGRVRAVAFDLPGHGGSGAPMRGPQDAWDSVMHVARTLDLDRPLLVGSGQGSHACLVAGLEGMGMFSGVVTLGGACVRSVQNATDDLTFYSSPEFADVLRTRFFFGYTGTTEQEAMNLVERMMARLPTDWRVIGFKGLREETIYSIRPAPDGQGWIHLPTPETLQRMLALKPSHRYYPDERLYRRIDFPVLIVQLTDGLDQEHAQRERDLAIDHPLVGLRVLDTGEYPHYTRYREVAGIILDACGRAAMHAREAAGRPAAS